MKTVLTSAPSVNGQADVPRSSANHTGTSPTATSHAPRVLMDEEMDQVAGGVKNDWIFAKGGSSNVKILS